MSEEVTIILLCVSRDLLKDVLMFLKVCVSPRVIYVKTDYSLFQGFATSPSFGVSIVLVSVLFLHVSACVGSLVSGCLFSGNFLK